MTSDLRHSVDSLQTPTIPLQKFPGITAVDSSTGTTPTLTPVNPIQNFESTLNEYQPSSSRQEVSSNNSMSPSNYLESCTVAGQTSSQRGKRNAQGLPVNPQLKAKLDKLEANAVSMDPLTAKAISLIKSGKSRQRVKDEELPDDEAERRKIRRERNKIAAARCRKRRLDLTNQLQEEVENLEDDKANLQSAVSELRSQKDQLQFIIHSHQPLCKLKKDSLSSIAPQLGRQTRSVTRPSNLHVTPNRPAATDRVHKGV